MYTVCCVICLYPLVKYFILTVSVGNIAISEFRVHIKAVNNTQLCFELYYYHIWIWI